MSLGVGTGSTIDILIELLHPLANKLGSVVSSSERSTKRLAEFGIRTVELASMGDLDLYIDGADEATKHRHLIKGGGGALTREKIVARRFAPFRLHRRRNEARVDARPVSAARRSDSNGAVVRRSADGEGRRPTDLARRVRHR